MYVEGPQQEAEVFSRITSFRFSGITGNTGKGLGLQGKSPQKVKPTGSPLRQSRVQTCAVSVLPDWRNVCTAMRTSEQEPPELKQVGRGPAPPRLGKGMGLTEAITMEGARLQSTGVWVGQAAGP